MIEFIKNYIFASRKMNLSRKAIPPIRKHKYDGGLDLVAPFNFVIYPGDSAVIDTGVSILLKPGEVGFIKSRSGNLFKYNIITDGVIDSGYTGSIGVKLINLGIDPFVVNRGDRIAQLVVCPTNYIRPVITEDPLDDTERGQKGFGSTGK